MAGTVTVVELLKPEVKLEEKNDLVLPPRLKLPGCWSLASVAAGPGASHGHGTRARRHARGKPRYPDAGQRYHVQDRNACTWSRAACWVGSVDVQGGRGQGVAQRLCHSL